MSKKVLEIAGMVGSTFILILLMVVASGLGKMSGWGFLGAFLAYTLLTSIIGIKLAGIPE